MKLISPLLKRVVYPALSATGSLHPRGVPGQLAIVTYHGLQPAGYVLRDSVLDGSLLSPAVFREQVRLLKRRYHVIAPELLLSWLRGGEALPPAAVLLTCDDGLRNGLTEMLPILLEEGLRCLFFVTAPTTAASRGILWYEELYLLYLRAPSGNVDVSFEGISLRGKFNSLEQRQALWWDSIRRLSQLDPHKRESFVAALRDRFRSGEPDASGLQAQASYRRFGLLTSDELRELASAGMTIGAHTMTHPMLSQAAPEVAFAEIRDSKEQLESVLHRPVWALAYPFGDPQSLTPKMLEMAREACFEAAFVNFGGGLGAELPPYALPRVHVGADMSLAEFEAHVSGLHIRLQRLAGRSSQTVAPTRL